VSAYRRDLTDIALSHHAGGTPCAIVHDDAETNLAGGFELRLQARLGRAYRSPPQHLTSSFVFEDPPALEQSMEWVL